MSVVASKRGKSEAEFIANARKLELFTLQKVVHFPKRYTFYLSQPIYRSASAVHQYVKHANSIFPKNQHEAQLRRDEFIKAKAELHGLISLIGMAREMFHISENVMTEWMELIKKELALISGEMNSEEKRYQNLPE